MAAEVSAAPAGEAGKPDEQIEKTGGNWGERGRFILGRIGQTLLVMVIITFITFAVFTLLPSDVAMSACGKPCTPENLAAVKGFYGLDKPFLVQFFDFFSGIFFGRTFGTGPAAVECAAPCFGYSFQLDQPVTTVIAQVFPVTASIAIGAVLIGLLLGVGAGIVSALRSGTLLDRSAMAFSVAGVSAPSYLVGFFAIILFGFGLGWFPVAGYIPITMDPVQWLYHLILPWLVLAFLSSAIYSRLTRATMIDVMQ